MRRFVLAVVAALVAFNAPPTHAEEPFYKNKQLTLLINFAAGGPTDIEGRLLAKHIVKHIAGHPNIVVENKDGAAGTVGATYLGELGPRDGSMVGYFTGTAWNYLVAPGKFRVDFRNYAFVGDQPGTTVYYIRTDIPPGMKEPADIMKAQGLVMGGLGRDSSKDLLQRLTFDMLGLKYRYVTGYRSSNRARLALQNGEINMHSESTPGYFGIVEPSLTKTGQVIPLWYDPSFDGKNFSAPKVVEGKGIMSFPEFYRSVKGSAPSGPLWEAYKTNLSVDAELLRIICMPPGSPPAAVAALRKAVLELNDDKDYAADAMTAIQFVPHYVVRPDMDQEVREHLTVPADMRNYILSYMKKVEK
jgi:tripartite-type tricarboxylate transporter receptor subunit TctC